MEIIDGLEAIDFGGRVWAYLYREADRATLIDTGIAGQADGVLSALEHSGASLANLRQIIITHGHRDHTGNLADLQERSTASTLAHELEAPLVRGDREVEAPRLSGPEQQIFEAVAGGIPDAQPAAVDRELHDGEELDFGGGARVVHLPGHTPGSIALHLPARRVLFLGDAVASSDAGRPMVGVFNVDSEMARQSLKRLAGLDFEVACFGHGRPIVSNAVAELRRLLEAIA